MLLVDWPIMMARIPIMLPRTPTEERVRSRLECIDRSRWYSNFGPQEVELRERYARFLGVHPEQVATASNATLALLGAATVGSARRWVMPSFTFAATPSAMLAAGHDVVFHDVEPSSWWLDAGRVAQDLDAITGLIPVAPFGAPPDLNRWPRDSEVVIDAAASLGAEPDLGSDLPKRWAVVFSLHATKVLGIGEGGLVVFGDPERAQRFRAWTNFGFDGGRESVAPGLNAKLAEVPAAYAHAALDGWGTEQVEWLSARANVEAVAREFDLGSPPGVQARVSPYWITTFPDERTCLRVERVLTAAGIGTRRWWGMGCHQMEAFRHLPRRSLSVTEQIVKTSLGLPMFRGLTSEDATEIASALSDCELIP